MSFLGGLIEVSGSAKYLESRKSHGKTASVSAAWKSTKYVESLTQELFSNIEFENNLLNPEATHVVTKILYGADAYFRFEKLLETNEDEKVVQGKLAGKVKSFFKIDGQVDITEDDKNYLEELNVYFNGDFTGIDPPTSYSEAVQVVKELSKSDAVVPMRVTLTPLHTLNDQAITLLREVNQDTIRRAAELKSLFETVDKTLSNELIGKSVEYFPLLEKNIRFLQVKFQQQSSYFRERLQYLLPRIRNNTVQELELTKVLDQIYNGPYHQSLFNHWLESRNSYANTLAEELLNQAKRGAEVLYSIKQLIDFQFSHKESYYVLEGSLRGHDETTYMNAIAEDDRSIVDNVPEEDRSAWVYAYRQRTIGKIRRFEKLFSLQTYSREEVTETQKSFNEAMVQRGTPSGRLTSPKSSLRNKQILKKSAALHVKNVGPTQSEVEGLNKPKLSIHIEMPGPENKLKINTYYGGQLVELETVKNIKFIENDDIIQFDIQEIELQDYPEYPEYTDYYYEGSKENPVFGYEIILRNPKKRTKSYHLNVLSKNTLTPEERYLINVRVILRGGVRGPWNSQPYVYTRPAPVIPVDGGWSRWQEVGVCSRSCGSGVQKFKRQCDSPTPFSGGQQCLLISGFKGLAEEKSEHCMLKSCPINCKVGPFTAWSGCSENCGDGKKTRTRSVIIPSQHGGARCPDLSQSIDCNPCREVEGWSDLTHFLNTGEGPNGCINAETGKSSWSYCN